MSEKKASDRQVGGDHYKTMGLQPLDAAYRRYGLFGLKAAIHTKVDKYMDRDKGTPLEDIDKSIHCLEILREYTERHMTMPEVDGEFNLKDFVCNNSILDDAIKELLRRSEREGGDE